MQQASIIPAELELFEHTLPADLFARSSVCAGAFVWHLKQSPAEAATHLVKTHLTWKHFPTYTTWYCCLLLLAVGTHPLGLSAVPSRVKGGV